MKVNTNVTYGENINVCTIDTQDVMLTDTLLKLATANSKLSDVLVVVPNHGAKRVAMRELQFHKDQHAKGQVVIITADEATDVGVLEYHPARTLVYRTLIFDDVGQHIVRQTVLNPKIRRHDTCFVYIGRKPLRI